jgi:hypothetical protein
MALTPPVQHVVGGVQCDGCCELLNGSVKVASRELLVPLVFQLVCSRLFEARSNTRGNSLSQTMSIKGRGVVSGEGMSAE